MHHPSNDIPATGACAVCAATCSRASWCATCAQFVCWSHEPHPCTRRSRPASTARGIPLEVYRARLIRVVELAREGLTDLQIMLALDVSADQVRRALTHPKYGLPHGGRRALRAEQKLAAAGGAQ